MREIRVAETNNIRSSPLSGVYDTPSYANITRSLSRTRFDPSSDDKMRQTTFDLIESPCENLTGSLQLPYAENHSWVVTLLEEQNTLISLSRRTCTSADALLEFKPETTARSLKWHVDKPRAEPRIPPAASFKSAVSRHTAQLVHSVRRGCLLPSSLWQYIKYVKSFGPTSL